MRAGKLKTRRYKTRGRGRKWLLFLLLLAALAGALIYLQGQGKLTLPIPMAPAPTLTPDEARQEERTITLPEQSWYALQLGAFGQLPSAQSLANHYEGRGAASFIYSTDTHRVLAAAYPTRADAQAVINQLQSQHQVDAYLFQITSPQLTVHITGQRAQLTALSDGLDALYQSAQHFSDLSQALDQRTLTGEEVRQALRSRQETLSSLAQRLRILFGPAPHAAVANLIAILDEAIPALQQALDAGNDTRLGGRVKYCHLLCIIRLAEYAQKLEGT